MARRLHILLLAICGFLVSSLASAEEVATGKQINSAAGYAFQLEGVGKLTLRSVEAEGVASNDCQVDVDSVRTIIMAGVKNRSLTLAANSDDGKTYITIHLQRHQTEDMDTGRRTVNCWGEGKGCRAKIEVSPPAADALSELML